MNSKVSNLVKSCSKESSLYRASQTQNVFP